MINQFGWRKRSANVRVELVLIGIMLAPTPANAGAWLREKGAGFVSVQTNLRHDALGTALETDSYGDYGLTPNLSLGFSIFSSGRQAGNATVFLRFPLGDQGAENKWSVETGIGAWWAPDMVNGLAKLTVSYGRNLAWGEANGWLSVENTVEKRLGISSMIWKLDATIGQSTGRGGRAPVIRPMVKMNTTKIAGQPLIWSVSANMLIDSKDGTTWLVGIERKQLREPSYALTMGLWRRF